MCSQRKRRNEDEMATRTTSNNNDDSDYGFDDIDYDAQRYPLTARLTFVATCLNLDTLTGSLARFADDWMQLYHDLVTACFTYNRSPSQHDSHLQHDSLTV